MPLHPFIAMVVEKQKATGWPGFAAGTPADARMLVAAGRAVIGTGPEMAEVRDLAIPTRSGTIAARLYIPRPDPGSLVVYFHGGGWVVGALDDFDTLAREIAARSGSAVLMPDYRLAPEYPFPAGLQDCEDTLAWVQTARNVLGHAAFGHAAPVIVAGDSAGANLATVAARKLRGTVKIAAQILVYPVTDCTFDTGSYDEHGTGLPLTRKDMEWFFAHYAPQDLHAHEDVSPLRAADLSGMPPTVILTAEYDVLRDEGAAYALKLQAAAVKVELRCYDGATHGFLRLHNLYETAEEAVGDIAAAIRSAVDGAGVVA